MPIYEFRCTRCGKDFEEIVRSQADVIICPSCGSKKTKKRMSAFSFKSTAADGTVTSSSSGCASCTSKNCSSCHS